MRPAFLFLIVCVCSRLSFFLHQRTLGPNRLFSFSVHPASAVSLFLPGYSFLYFYYAIASRCVDWLPTRSLLDECSAHCLPIPTPPHTLPSLTKSIRCCRFNDGLYMCFSVSSLVFFSLRAHSWNRISERDRKTREAHTDTYIQVCSCTTTKRK